MRYTVRVLSLLAPVIAVFPAAAKLFIGWATAQQFYDLPEHIAAILHVLASFSGFWLYPWVAGGVLGAWLVLLAQSLAPRREDRESPILLAWHLRDLVRKIERLAEQNGASRVPPDLESEVQSAMSRLARLGIVDPRDRATDPLTRLTMASHFLSRLIPYLHNEQIREARRLAKAAAESGEYRPEPTASSVERPRRRLLLRRRPPRPEPGPVRPTEA